jgi:hypothetical protein
MFSAPATPAPSLFQPAGTLFGQPNAGQPSLFNAASPLQPPPSLFNPSAPNNQNPTPSLFGQPTAQPNFAQVLSAAVTNSFGQTPNTPMNNAFTQLASPLFTQQQQQQPGMDQAMQLLIPQLLVNYALTQSQQQQADPNNSNQFGNPVMDMLNKLVTAMNVDKNNQQTNNVNSLLTPTPFDELLKEEYNNKWS